VGREADESFAARAWSVTPLYSYTCLSGATLNEAVGPFETPALTSGDGVTTQF
jgi:hypothetical protein